jgi:hypothetical protein
MKKTLVSKLAQSSSYQRWLAALVDFGTGLGV